MGLTLNNRATIIKSMNTLGEGLMKLVHKLSAIVASFSVAALPFAAAAIAGSWNHAADGIRYAQAATLSTRHRKRGAKINRLYQESVWTHILP
jgi:hypothetical protein